MNRKQIMSLMGVLVAGLGVSALHGFQGAADQFHIKNDLKTNLIVFNWMGYEQVIPPGGVWTQNPVGGTRENVSCTRIYLRFQGPAKGVSLFPSERIVLWNNSNPQDKTRPQCWSFVTDVKQPGPLAVVNPQLNPQTEGMLIPMSSGQYEVEFTISKQAPKAADVNNYDYCRAFFSQP